MITLNIDLNFILKYFTWGNFILFYSFFAFVSAIFYYFVSAKILIKYGYKFSGSNFLFNTIFWPYYLLKLILSGIVQLIYIWIQPLIDMRIEQLFGQLFAKSVWDKIDFTLSEQNLPPEEKE